jgi:major membrane immunogen (membrane-anchored lipoprotein)
MKKPLIVVALAALVLASGCGRDEARVAVNTKDAKITVAGGNASVALPDNFPKDLPIMPGGSVKGVIKAGEATSIQMVVSASPQEVAKYYQDSLNGQGWKVENTIAAGKVTMFTAVKDTRQASFQIGDNDGKNAAVMISLRPKN